MAQHQHRRLVTRRAHFHPIVPRRQFHPRPVAALVIQQPNLRVVQIQRQRP